MFETSMMLTMTDYAMKRSGKLHGKLYPLIETSEHD